MSSNKRAVPQRPGSREPNLQVVAQTAGGDEVTVGNFYAKLVEFLPKTFGPDNKPFTVDLRRVPHVQAMRARTIFNRAFNGTNADRSEEEADEEAYELACIMDPTWTRAEIVALNEVDHDQLVALAFAGYKEAKAAIIPLRIGKR